MATMKIEVVNPYDHVLEYPFPLDCIEHKQTLNYVERLVIQHEKQQFYLVWDDNRNALRIIDESNNGTLCVFPSTANGILIQSVKQ
jgi:hypothetical protein